MALPLAMVIVAAEIDLSVASVMALSSAVMAYLWNHNQPVEFIIPICMARRRACGAFNGVLVTRFGLPSLAVTIGTLALFRGLAFVVIGDESVTDFSGGLDRPGVRELRRDVHPEHGRALRRARRRLRGAAPCDAVRPLDLRDRRQRGGRVLLGAARQARQAHPVHLCGAVAALAGVVITLRNSTGAANVGQGFELTVVTAVLLGGVSIFGGRGTIPGSSSRLLLLGGIQKALLLSESISSYWIQIVTGTLLVGSVLGPNLARRVADTRRRRSRPLPEEGS